MWGWGGVSRFLHLPYVVTLNVFFLLLFLND